MRRGKQGGRHRFSPARICADRGAALLGAAVLCAAALITVILVGSPIYARHMLCLPRSFPPSWVMFLLGGIAYLLLGAVLGHAASSALARPRVKLRGVLFLLGAAFFRLVWYPFFFGLIAPLCGALVLMAALLCLFCALAEMRCCLRAVLPALLAVQSWTAFLLWNTLAVFFLN